MQHLYLSKPEPVEPLKPDTEVWSNFKNGCEEAFSYIFKNHYSFLFNYGIKLTPNHDLVKDSIQELFVILWETRNRLGETQSIKFYLLKSFRRHLIRTLQNAAKGKEKNSLSDNYQFEVVFSYERKLIGEESFLAQQHALFKEMNNLSPRQKEIVYLKFYNELSYQEIAEMTSLNYQSVRNYMHQALVSLRKKKSLLAAIYTLACLLFTIFLAEYI